MPSIETAITSQLFTTETTENKKREKKNEKKVNFFSLFFLSVVSVIPVVNNFGFVVVSTLVPRIRRLAFTQ